MMTLAQRTTSTIDVFNPQTFQTMCQMAEVFIRSGMLPQSIKTPEQAIVIMAKGKELGLEPLQALNGINVIQGKPTVSPQLMLSLINRSGKVEDLKFETGADFVTCTMHRKGRTPHTERFGAREAQAMGLAGKDNYKKQPLVMYKWRAVAACARVVFPDVIDGLYTPEEVGADVSVDEEGTMTIEVAQVAPQATPEPVKAKELKFISADAAGRLRAQLSKLGIANAEDYANRELAFDATGKPLEKLTELTTEDAKQLFTIATSQPIGKDEAHHLHGILSAMLKNAGVSQKDKDWASATLGKTVGSFAELTRPERMQLLSAAESLQEQPA